MNIITKNSHILGVVNIINCRAASAISIEDMVEREIYNRMHKERYNDYGDHRYRSMNGYGTTIVYVEIERPIKVRVETEETEAVVKENKKQITNNNLKLLL